MAAEGLRGWGSGVLPRSATSTRRRQVRYGLATEHATLLTQRIQRSLTGREVPVRAVKVGFVEIDVVQGHGVGEGVATPASPFAAVGARRVQG